MMFSRSEALLGAEALARLRSACVAVVGVGGVGSWCAEALVRTGIGQLVLIDDDIVQKSNLNRQCPALSSTIGEPKVAAMADRLRSIDPACRVDAVRKRFIGFGDDVLESCDMIVDAIDSVDCKAELILGATERNIPIVSSLGAALRIDPTRVRVKRFDKVEGDGLARALRQRFKKLGRFPAAKFDCVCSEEPALACAERGSLMQVTAVFGMCLAAEVVKHLSSAHG